MGTTTEVPTESESRLAGSEQVKHPCFAIGRDILSIKKNVRRLVDENDDLVSQLREALEGIEYLRSFIADGHVPCSKDFATRWDEASETIRAAIAKAEGRTP